MVANLLDLMTEEERLGMEERLKSRRERGKVEVKVSPETYMLAEFGYFFGWEAVQSVRNNEVSYSEMFSMLEAAKKVWYAKLIETASANRVSMNSAMAAKGADGTKAFERGMEPFRRNLKLED